MENILKIIQDLALAHVWAMWILVVCSALGSLVVVASSVVLMTPTKKDDELLAKIESNSVISQVLSVIKFFSLVKPK